MTGSTTGMSQSPTSRPRSRSIQGNAFSWPIARMTSSQGITTVSTTVEWRACSSHSSRWNSMPTSVPVLDDEPGRGVVDDDLDTLLLGILELPRRRLEERARTARHHLDVGAAEAERRAAAVHRGVADADDQHALADGVDVPEGDRLEPVDADVDPVAVVASRDVEVLAPWRAGPDEHRVEVLLEQRAQARDRRVEAKVDAHVDDGGDLLVEDLCREPERGDVGAHEPARLVMLLEDDHVVAERHQVVGDGERRGPRADADHPPAGLGCRDHRAGGRRCRRGGLTRRA